MTTGITAAVSGIVKEKEAKTTREREKMDTDTVAKLLVNTDLPANKIAEIAKVSEER